MLCPELMYMLSVNFCIIDFNTIAMAQADDAELHKLRTATNTSLKFKDIPVQGTQWPFVPKQFQYTVCEKLHSLAHLGIRASHYIWPGINTDVCNRTRHCLPCQKAKTHKHMITPLSIFATPDSRFEHIHIDLVGPLPSSNGCSYILTCINQFTCWVEAAPIADITTPTTRK